jgi:hypothetical protein
MKAVSSILDSAVVGLLYMRVSALLYCAVDVQLNLHHGHVLLPYAKIAVENNRSSKDSNWSNDGPSVEALSKLEELHCKAFPCHAYGAYCLANCIPASAPPARII